MGFLHKLWDETLAGPTPDTGLSRLRKYHSSRPTVSPIITILRRSSDFRGFSSDSGLLTSKTPREDFEKFSRGKSPVQSPVVTTTPTEFYWVMISALDR
ncbi:dormancy-associated protein homolog 4-like [Prosopis cineraria]|uniref:dormancy-associated protein homolog 4-like n=1 Tax=Prosopis cineraria TaxID=364024 RepID=UPI00240EDD79|nr:dormancy-associated protein homolog 4-like [Prosopis cineraria]XP_054793915.1 dormancy-associated protein homolog 4-like [Prosopis cineraria]